MKELKISKTVNFKRLLTAVAMTACVFSHAFAATPKTESTILHDKITLGDVFDGVTDNADYYLAPAPAMGQSVTLGASDLVRISDAFKLGWSPVTKMEQVVVRRASSEIDRFDIQAALQEKISEEMKGQKFDMELSDRAISFRIPEGAEKNVDVDSLSLDAAKGEFKAVVSVKNVKKEVKGKLYPIHQLPVLRDPLRQGDVIGASDIEYIDIRASDVTPTMVVDAQKLIGLTPRRGIPALKPIVAGDVQQPMVVKKGELVTMTLKSNIISLTAQGKALDNGAAGDVIRVMNTASKQVIDAVITGPQTVNVKAPSNALSMNTL